LQNQGLYNKKHEIVHNIVIVIGGLEDESLHYDIPKQTINWSHGNMVSHHASDHYAQSSVTKWEVNRLEYNSAMTGQFPPRTIWVGLGNTDKVKIGIQNNQIIRLRYVLLSGC
jgi:hypothetical protein